MSPFARSLLDAKKSYLDDVRDGKGTEWTVVMGNEAGGGCSKCFPGADCVLI